MRRHGRPFVSAALPAVFPPLLLVLLLTTSALALPVQNDSSVENSRLIADLLAGGSTAEPQRTSGRWDSPLESNQTFVSGPIHRLSEEQWERLTSPPDGRPLITDVAFKLTGRPSPRYAFVTASSYNQYLEYLGTLCRKAEDGDIAEVRLNSLDNDYFAWEELQFNRAIIKRIFPEHEQGDHRRYLEASRTLRKMHLRADPASQCVPPKTEDTWSARVAERNQFEDFIINTIFRPHFDAFAEGAFVEEDEEPAGSNRVRRHAAARPSARERRRLERAAKAEAALFRAKRKFR